MLEFTEAIFGFTLSRTQESFTAFCYQNKTMTELFLDVCKSGADKADCKKWQLTAQQWRRCIAVALYHAGIDMTFDVINNDESNEPNTGKHRQAMTKEEACYIFGIAITDNETSFLGELCKRHGIYKDTCLVKARQPDCKKWNLTSKQWRRCIAMAIYEELSDIFMYGL